jgi:hypothetical protein
MATGLTTAEKLPLEVTSAQSSTSINIDIEDPTSTPARLRRDLQGRHMQMIAIGRFLFVGTRFTANSNPNLRGLDWRRSLCWLWKIIGGWGSRIAAYRIHRDRSHRAVHNSSLGRTNSYVSREWCFLLLCCPFHRSRLVC